MRYLLLVLLCGCLGSETMEKEVIEDSFYDDGPGFVDGVDKEFGPSGCESIIHESEVDGKMIRIEIPVMCSEMYIPGKDPSPEEQFNIGIEETWNY